VASPKQIQEALIKLLSEKSAKGRVDQGDFKQETILNPAMRLPDSNEIVPGRFGQQHFEILDEAGREVPKNVESGFITPDGTFLDRNQSVRFLDELGSLDDVPEVQGQKRLIAEDLFEVDMTGSTATEGFTEESLLQTILKVLESK
jgi:hypothetical protein